MKKLIQICSMLGLLAVFAVVSANAQTGFGTDVEIPFAFNVGDKSYDAGHYIIKVSKFSSGAATLSIQDTKTDKMQTVLMSVNGDDASNDMKLVFETAGGTKYLSKVSTSASSFGLVKPASHKRVGGKAPAVVGGSANLF